MLSSAHRLFTALAHTSKARKQRPATLHASQELGPGLATLTVVQCNNIPFILIGCPLNSSDCLIGSLSLLIKLPYCAVQVGTDANAVMLRAALHDSGVSLDHLRTVDGPTGTAVILLQPSGAISRSPVVRQYPKTLSWTCGPESSRAAVHPQRQLPAKDLPSWVLMNFGDLSYTLHAHMFITMLPWATCHVSTQPWALPSQPCDQETLGHYQPNDLMTL